MSKKGLSENKSIRDTMIDVMTEFYEQVIFPHFDGRLVPIEKDVKALKENMEDVQQKLDRNRDEHDRMFIRLDRIEKKVDGHEPRIKKLEKTLQAA